VWLLIHCVTYIDIAISEIKIEENLKYVLIYLQVATIDLVPVNTNDSLCKMFFKAKI
jgi:hypothetical protein